MDLIARHTRDLTRKTSNETQHFVNHRISVLDPLVDLSPVGRHRPRHGKRRDLKPCRCAHSGRLALRNAGARRTAIRVRHHPAWVAPWIRHPHHPHERGWYWRPGGERPQRSLLLRLDD